MRHEKQQGIHLLRVPGAAEIVEGIARPVEPEIVGIEAEERVGQQALRMRLHQPAAGFHQQLAFVRNGDLRLLALLHMGFERVGKVVDVDHRLCDTGLVELLESVIDQRLAGHPHQRLGLACGERAHTLAQPRRQDHRGVRRKRAQAMSPPSLSRTSRGILASNHAATGASAGWARSRSIASHTRGIMER